LCLVADLTHLASRFSALRWSLFACLARSACPAPPALPRSRVETRSPQRPAPPRSPPPPTPAMPAPMQRGEGQSNHLVSI
jgi:hypothetical protein